MPATSFAFLAALFIFAYALGALFRELPFILLDPSLEIHYTRV
jgi:hypothetical protein